MNTRHQIKIACSGSTEQKCFGTEPKCLNTNSVLVNFGVWDRAQTSDDVFTASQTKQNSRNQLQIKWILQKWACIVDRVVETCPILLRLYKYQAFSMSSPSPDPNVSKIHTNVFCKTHSSHYFFYLFHQTHKLWTASQFQKYTGPNRGHSPAWNATQLHLLFQPLVLALWSVYFYRRVKKRERGRKGRAVYALRELYLGSDPLSCSLDWLSVSMKATVYLLRITMWCKAL